MNQTAPTPEGKEEMPQATRLDDVRIRDVRPLISPALLQYELPADDAVQAFVERSRTAVAQVVHGADPRLLMVVGPCSIHDSAQALEYARRLHALAAELKDDLLVVMRVYFEKPRTTVGWKGFINDPRLDGSFRINEGLRRARELLLEIAHMGLPAGTEFLDLLSPQYIADLVSWGAIGARTTESQVHRELASGLSCPVGFKNGTDGNLRIAFDAIKAASQPHHFLSVTKGGHSAIVSTLGNEDCHVILRGGSRPNYDRESVVIACRASEAAGLPCRLMIDASHGNSLKDPGNQRLVVAEVAEQLAGGSRAIFGMMIESHLVAGRQELVPGAALTYGQSITDGCAGWDETIEMLDRLADAVTLRRSAVPVHARAAAI